MGYASLSENSHWGGIRLDVKIKGFFEKVKDFFKKMSKKTRLVLGATTAVLIIGIVAFVIWANNKPYEVLWTGQSSSEASSVLSWLSENGVTDYKVQGDSILVPADRVNVLKGQLVLAGYPKNGYLFDVYFDHINSLSTTSEQDRVWLMGLEEKMRSVICTLDGIRDATVSITLGKDRTYILEDNVTESSAAVTLELDGSTQLSSRMVNAIAGVVAHAVEGLTIDNVIITDQYYNSYTAGDAISSISEASALKVKLEQETSNNVRSQVFQVLGSVYGQDNVKVAVNCNVDVSRKIIEDTQYSQPTGAPDDGGGLIGSQTWFWQVARDGLATTGGVVGTPSNSEIPNYMNNGGALDGEEDYAAGQGSNERDNNKRVEQSEVLAGTITDIGIAVTINANASNAWAVDEAMLKSHVAAAANIGGEDPESRVSVLIAPFHADTVVGPISPILPVPDYVLYIAAGVLVLLLILAIVLMIVGRKRKKKQQLEEQRLLEEQQGQALTLEEAEAIAAATAAATASGGTGADIMEINTEKSMELRKAVRQFAQNNPEIAAQMIKTWLRGGEENG